MANKVYQLQYDDTIDRDIHEWLQSLPRSRKAEMVRNAIRHYLAAAGQGTVIPVIPPTVTASIVSEVQSEPEKKELRRRPKLSTDGNF